MHINKKKIKIGKIELGVHHFSCTGMDVKENQFSVNEAKGDVIKIAELFNNFSQLLNNFRDLLGAKSSEKYKAGGV